MDGARLTEEGGCQIYQIVQFLEQPQQIVTEGIFRKHGNLKKQQVLKQKLNRGTPITLDDGEFSVHECAAVLKGFLQDLPEPVLTEAHYEAHRQVAQMKGEKRVQALQLLAMLLPDPNYNLLKDLLLFLYKVTQNQDRNKMDSTNLGLLFGAHLMCPRKMSTEELQSSHHLFTEAVAFMIDTAPRLFDTANPPPQLLKDITAHNGRKCATPKRHMLLASAPASEADGGVTPKAASDSCTAGSGRITPSVTPAMADNSSSPVVNTIFSFVDHTKSREIASSQSTETALAELYAQVHSMPESAKKKRLIKQFNEANGCGTPRGAGPKGTPGALALGRDTFKNWIVPKVAGAGSKGCSLVKDKKSGSYDLKATKAEAEAALTPTFLLRKSSSSSDEDVLSTPKSMKPVHLIVTPSTPKAENQNNLYCKKSGRVACSAMADECDSMAETKQLTSPDKPDSELLRQIQMNTPKPEFKSSEKENFV